MAGTVAQWVGSGYMVQEFGSLCPLRDETDSESAPVRVQMGTPETDLMIQTPIYSQLLGS